MTFHNAFSSAKRLTLIVLAISAVTACSTVRPCHLPNQPELALLHGSYWSFSPVRSLALEGNNLSITGNCYPARTWCATLTEGDTQILRERLADPRLIGEVVAHAGGMCATDDTRYAGIDLSHDRAFSFCYDYIDQTPQVKSLFELVDRIASKYFGWRYGHTFTTGPTLLQRVRANNYRCPPS